MIINHSILYGEYIEKFAWLLSGLLLKIAYDYIKKFRKNRVIIPRQNLIIKKLESSIGMILNIINNLDTIQLYDSLQKNKFVNANITQLENEKTELSNIIILSENIFTENRKNILIDVNNELTMFLKFKINTYLFSMRIWLNNLKNILIKLSNVTEEFEFKDFSEVIKNLIKIIESQILEYNEAE